MLNNLKDNDSFKFTDSKSDSVNNFNPRNKPKTSKNFSYFNQLESEIFEQGVASSESERAGFAGLTRYTYAEIEKDARDAFAQRIATNEAILKVGGCQTINEYICDAECNRIVKVKSNCLPNYKYKRINPSEIFAFVGEKIKNAFDEDRNYFVLKCKEYKQKGWKLEAYAQKDTLNFFIKFSKLRNPEKDIINSTTPAVSVWMRPGIFIPPLRIPKVNPPDEFDEIDSNYLIIQNIQEKWPNKIFILKYHWDQKDNVCRDLSLPLNVELISNIYQTDEYLTSIDALYSSKAGIFRYSPYFGTEPMVPNLDFDNMKDKDPEANLSTETQNQDSFLNQIKKLGEDLDEKTPESVIDKNLESLNNLG